MTRLPKDSQTQGLAVSAFGKCPGWRDHIDDPVVVALNTPGLRRVADAFHLQAFQAALRTGKWDELPVDRAYYRCFSRLERGSLVVGRLWSSADSSGQRDQFPMALCVDLGSPDRLSHTIPEADRWLDGPCRTLRELRDRSLAVIEEYAAGGSVSFEEAPARERVRGVVDLLRRRLKSGLPDGDLWQSEERHAARELVEWSGWGESRLGLHRVLWAVEQAVGPIAENGEKRARRREKEWRLPAQVRAGDGGKPGAMACAAWLELLTRILGDDFPITVLAPAAGGFTDVLLGEPGPDEVLCLKVGPCPAIPLSNEVTPGAGFDEAFRQHADRLLAPWLAEGELLAGVAPPSHVDAPGSATEPDGTPTSAAAPTPGEMVPEGPPPRHVPVVPEPPASTVEQAPVQALHPRGDPETDADVSEIQSAQSGGDLAASEVDSPGEPEASALDAPEETPEAVPAPAAEVVVADQSRVGIAESAPSRSAPATVRPSTAIPVPPGSLPVAPVPVSAREPSPTRAAMTPERNPRRWLPPLGIAAVLVVAGGLSVRMMLGGASSPKPEDSKQGDPTVPVPFVAAQPQPVPDPRPGRDERPRIEAIAQRARSLAQAFDDPADSNSATLAGESEELAAKVAALESRPCVTEEDAQSIGRELVQIAAAADELDARVEEREQAARVAAVDFLTPLQAKSFQAPPLDALWTALLSSCRADQGLRPGSGTVVQAWQNAFSQSLSELRAAPRPDVDPGHAAAVEMLTAARRAEAIEGLAETVTPEALRTGQTQVFLARARVEADKLGDWMSGVADVGSRIAAIDERISQGEMLDEAAGAGVPTLRDAMMASEDDADRLGARVLLDPLLARRQRLDDLSQAPASHFTSNDVTGLAEQRTAWTRLTAIDHWRSEEGLAFAAAQIESMGVEIKRIEDPAIQEERAVWLKRQAQSAWMTHLLARESLTPEVLTGLGSVMERFFLAPDSPSLPAWVRFNYAWLHLQQETAKCAGDDAAIRELADRFARNVEPLRDSLPQAAISLLDELDSAGEAGGPPQGAFHDALSRAGPGSRGWNLVSITPDASLVSYAWPNREQRLDFVRIEPPGVVPGVAHFLAATELPAGLLIALAAEPFARDEGVLGALGEVEHFGPSSWTLAPTRDGLEIATLWLGSRERRGRAYPPGREPEGPSEQSPATDLEPPVAASLASMVGCRLPTVSEWNTAASTESVESWNVRDACWGEQWEFMFAASGPRGDVDRFGTPECGAISAFHTSFPKDDGQLVTDRDDRWLWFAPVNAEMGSRFRHIRGNVAEWAFDGAADDLAFLEARPVAVSEAGNRLQLSLVKACGGSALQRPEADQILTIPPGRRLNPAFSDVGVRFAFSCFLPQGQNPASRMRSIILADTDSLPAGPPGKAVDR